MLIRIIRINWLRFLRCDVFGLPQLLDLLALIQHHAVVVVDDGALGVLIVFWVPALGIGLVATADILGLHEQPVHVGSGVKVRGEEGGIGELAPVEMVGGEEGVGLDLKSLGYVAIL